MIETAAVLRRYALTLFGGAAIGTTVGLALYVMKPIYVALLPLTVAIFLGAAFFRNFRLYWFAVFLLSMQLPISKNLNDGYLVLKSLNIDYVIWNFTFQVTVSDLVFVILMAIWANDCFFHRKRLRVPRITWLATGYLASCLLSLIGASSPYLGFVQLWTESKYVLGFVFAVNCLDTKPAARVLAVVGAAIILIQATTTVVRFETGNVSSLFVGGSTQDVEETKRYLTVDRQSGEESGVRGFGTLDGPAATNRLLLMVIPFALFLSVRNAMFRARWPFAAASAFGMLGILLTFTRVYFIVIALQLTLVFLLMVRDRVLKRQEVILIVLLAFLALAAGSAKLYEQFTVRSDSVSVRFLQYEAATKMISDHLLLGVGLNNGTAVKQKYSTLTRNPRDPDTYFDTEPTHSMYLSMASEIGLVGTALYLAFFGTIILFTYKQSRRLPDPEVRLIANVFLVVFCSVGFTGFMDPFQDFSGNGLLWLYAGMSLNLPRMAHDAGSERERARLT